MNEIPVDINKYRVYSLEMLWQASLQPHSAAASLLAFCLQFVFNN